MPKPSEICVVTAGGFRFDNWETIDVTTNTDTTIDHAMLTVTEPRKPAGNLSQIKLKPGDRATVTLAGQTVIDGVVYLREAAMDARSHIVRIGLCSYARNVINSSVDAAPGQYVNQNLSQIASAVFGTVGIQYSTSGSPAGADKVFERVSEHIGETRFSFIERLSRMRNIWLVDDGANGIVGFRGPQGSAQYPLKEGFNILRGRVLLRDDEHLELITAVGHYFGQDSADTNRGSQAQASSDPPDVRSEKFLCEEMADFADCQLRANHQRDRDVYHQIDGEITVQGWLNPTGKLWWEDRRKLIAVYAPSLLYSRSW